MHNQLLMVAACCHFDYPEAGKTLAPLTFVTLCLLRKPKYVIVLIHHTGSTKSAEARHCQQNNHMECAKGLSSGPRMGPVRVTLLTNSSFALLNAILIRNAAIEPSFCRDKRLLKPHLYFKKSPTPTFAFGKAGNTYTAKTNLHLTLTTALGCACNPLNRPRTPQEMHAAQSQHTYRADPRQEFAGCLGRQITQQGGSVRDRQTDMYPARLCCCHLTACFSGHCA